MPDALDRALDARLDAYRPGNPPPLEALLARKRRRARRRAGGAVALAAVAVGAVAVVPAVVGGERAATPRYAAPEERYAYHVQWETYDAASDAALRERCLELPGLSDGGIMYSYPPQYGGRVTGRDAAAALQRCVAEHVPGASVTLRPLDAEPTPSAAPEQEGRIRAAPTTKLAETDEFGLVVRTSVDAGRVLVAVDRVDMLSGEEAADASEARGQGRDVPNDYFLVNDNPRTREYVLAPDVEIWQNYDTPVPGHRRITVTEWRAYVAGEAGRGMLWHLDVEDGEVVGIEGQYRP